MHHGKNRRAARKRKLSKKRKFKDHEEDICTFVEIGKKYNFCRNRGEYAMCIIGLGGWTPLTAISGL